MREQPARRRGPSQPRAWLGLAAVVMTVVVVPVLVGRWQSRTLRIAEAPPTFEVSRAGAGVQAPPIDLKDLDGHRVQLADFKGRVVLLNFWATWCPPCRDELPALAELPRDFGEPGLSLLTVNQEEAPESVRRFLADLGLHVPALLDTDGAVGRRYGLLGIPTTVAVDRRGRIVGRMVGYRDWASAPARSYLEGLLREPGDPPIDLGPAGGERPAQE